MNKEENVKELSEGEPSETKEGVKIIEYKSQTPALDAEFVDGVGKRIELMATLARQAIRALRPHDIDDFQNKPYIEGEGAARIMVAVRGFHVDEAHFEIEEIEGHYFIDCSLPVQWQGASTVGQGDCSTADSFWQGKLRSYKEQTGSDRIAIRLLLGDVRKKARENALSRAVCELLGLKGLSWEDFEKLGFNRAGAGARVEFLNPQSKKYLAFSLN